MPDYLVVKLKDVDTNPWTEVPRLWLRREDDNDDDSDDDNYDYDLCWWPNNDVWYKAKNKIIFHGSTRGWYLRNVLEVDDIDYDSIEEAERRADVLNRQVIEDNRYNQLSKQLSTVENILRFVSSDQYKMSRNLSEMKEILIGQENQGNANKVKPTLETLLPIKSSEDLITFETRFLNEDWISPALKELIGILTDDQNINESISRILDAIFSRELVVQCSWDGQNGLKIKDLSIIKKIEVTLKNINAEYDGFQAAVTSWFYNNGKSAMVSD